MEFENSSLDILLNPVVIVEVLSPTTEANDRGRKFAHYRRLATLKDYVLLSPYQPQVEHYTRPETDLWILQEISDLSGILHLHSLGCELPLAEIYDRIEFPSEPSMPGEIIDSGLE